MLVREKSADLNFGGVELDLRGDLSAVKENLISLFREQITSSIEEFESEFPGRVFHVDYKNFYFPDCYFSVGVMREETPEEEQVRLIKEKAAAKRRETLLAKKRDKDLAMATKLAAEHGIVLDLK